MITFGLDLEIFRENNAAYKTINSDCCLFISFCHLCENVTIEYVFMGMKITFVIQIKKNIELYFLGFDEKCSWYIHVCTYILGEK